MWTLPVQIRSGPRRGAGSPMAPTAGGYIFVVCAPPPPAGVATGAALGSGSGGSMGWACGEEEAAKDRGLGAAGRCAALVNSRSGTKAVHSLKDGADLAQVQAMFANFWPESPKFAPTSARLDPNVADAKKLMHRCTITIPEQTSSFRRWRLAQIVGQKSRQKLPTSPQFRSMLSIPGGIAPISPEIRPAPVELGIMLARFGSTLARVFFNPWLGILRSASHGLHGVANAWISSRRSIGATSVSQGGKPRTRVES